MAEAAVFSISTQHQIFYNTKEPVPIRDLVDSLLAAESVLKRAPLAIKKLMPDIEIEEINIYVNEIVSGSIFEDLIIAIVFGDKEKYENFLTALGKIRKGEIKELTKEEQAVAVKQLLFLIFVGVVSWGATMVAQSGDANPQPPPQQAIQQTEMHNSNVINFGSATFNCTADEVREMIEAAVQPNKKQLAKDVTKIMQPARSDPESSIVIDGNDALAFKPELVKEVPEKFEEPVPEEKIEKYSNADVVVFASDRDNHEKGWAGIVPTIVDKRTRITLAKDIGPEKLHGRLRLRADVSIISNYNKAKKKYIASEIYITNTD